ncbi:hypothetical protein E2C01_025984 [Portunus trituberculatus]|uniref:Uncharacterized protein n=1 Tax=Portunus trituberculatus TaxID=210409 RepID=A0A5B7EHG4_PORTR|nr:hypothetical protein [Portunus trituberculatus]
MELLLKPKTPHDAFSLLPPACCTHCCNFSPPSAEEGPLWSPRVVEDEREGEQWRPRGRCGGPVDLCVRPRGESGSSRSVSRALAHSAL